VERHFVKPELATHWTPEMGKPAILREYRCSKAKRAAWTQVKGVEQPGPLTIIQTAQTFAH
jgi:hypothetical protein